MLLTNGDANTDCPPQILLPLIEDARRGVAADKYIARPLRDPCGSARRAILFEGAKLFWPEEFPEVIAEEARKLWGVAS